MSKILKFKEWLTLPDAAQHLSSLLAENVSQADILRLALDDHLKLSIYFVNKARARSGTVVPIDQAKMNVHTREKYEMGLSKILLRDVHLTDEFPEEIKKGLKDNSLLFFVQGIRIRDKEILELDEGICKLEGVYDLPMIGAERLDIEHLFQQETGGPEVTLQALDGAFVESSNGQLFQLQEHFSDNNYFDKKNLKKPWDHPNNFYPAGSLPEDGALVVRTNELVEFCGRVKQEDQPTSRQLGDRAETTYLNIVAALLEVISEGIPNPEKRDGKFGPIYGFNSEAKLITAIAEHFMGYDGLSQSNLQRKFPEAKRSLAKS